MEFEKIVDEFLKDQGENLEIENNSEQKNPANELPELTKEELEKIIDKL